jgi:hypothetical protein
MQIMELHECAIIKFCENEFRLRISSSGYKAKTGCKIGSEKNNESFVNALVGMNYFSISIAKFDDTH